MNYCPNYRAGIFTICFLTVSMIGVELAVCQSTPGFPQPLVIRLSDTTTHYQPLLNGPPQTTSMESGLVVLLPGESGTQHSSKGYEEVLVVLSGEGEMVISGGPTLKLSAYSVAYCPTYTEHHVRNTGNAPLRYVYVAAQVVK